MGKHCILHLVLCKPSTNETSTSATLNFSLTDLGGNANTDVSFDYGYTTDYDHITPSYDWSTTPVNYNAVPQTVSHNITGLIPGQKVYYRIVLDGRCS